MPTPTPPGSDPPRTEPGRGRSAGLGRSFAITMGGSLGALVFSLFTGIVSARLLGPDGRGVLGAITAWVMVVALLGNAGMKDGLSYLESRDHRRAPAILTLALTSVFVLSVISVLIAELLIPIGFRAQSDEAVRFARLFMVWVLPFMACNVFVSQFGARQRFGAITMMRAGQPFLYAIGLGALWLSDRGDLGEVLLVQSASYVITGLVAFASLYRESGLGRLDSALGRKGWSYGIRAYGSSLGSLTNSRIDQVVLPAIVVAEEIGLYVVAVRAASMIVGLFGSFSMVLFPATARAGGERAVLMSQRAIRLVVVLSASGSIVLFAAATPAITLLYGQDFAGSVLPLRLLLPGVVFWAGSQIVISALKGMGRPVAGSVVQFIGVGVTAVGLALTLPAYGIEGAAITSSVSYCVVFVAGLVQLSRITGTKVSETLSVRSIAGDLTWLRQRVRRGAADENSPTATT